MKSPQVQLANIALIIVLIAGVFFRLYNLTHKAFWLDEAHTAASMAGTDYGKQDFFPAGKPIEAGKILSSYQQLNRRSGLSGMIDALAHEPVQHAPFFYILLYAWLSAIGSSLLTMRLLPALISLLQLPATYWFCLELWGTPAIAALAMALMALSPLEVVYAQQAREYSLYVVAVLLACASFLKAMRLQTLKLWGLYCGCLILALNTSLLTMFSVFAHFVYILIRKRAGAAKTLLRFLGSLSIALCTCLPWLTFYGQHLDVEMGIKSSPQNMPYFDLFKSWCLNFSCSFFDVGHYDFRSVQVLTAIVLLIEVCALFVVWLRSKRTAAFLLIIIAMNVLPVIAHDIIFPTQRSAQVRYQLPAMIAILVGVAYAIKASTLDKVIWRRNATLLLATCLIFSELVSCIANSQATLWRTQTYKLHDLIKVANVLNQDNGTVLLVSDMHDLLNQIQFLCLSHQLRPQTWLELVAKPGLPTLPEGTSHFFLYNVSPELKSYLASSGRYTLNTVDGMDYLVRVDPK
jgi:uncharacterized membrane protein